MIRRKFLGFLCSFLLFSVAVWAQDPKEIMGHVKANLEKSTKALRAYEWLETTTVSKDGKVKSTQQKRCYYGVDGKLYKVATGATEAAKTPGGLRGKIAENKKEEAKDYVESCVKKVEEYLPPNAEKLQAAYGAGKMAMQVTEPNKRYQLNFSNYLQQGDLLGIGLDKEKQMLTAMQVKTYVEKPADAVQFGLTYGIMPDGTQYPSETVIEMPSKGLKITVRNEGYKKGNQ